MSDATLHATTQDPDDFAVQIADQVESFIVAVTEVAKGDEPDSAVPFLLLEVSQLLLAGGRLGAHEDIVPDERYEPDLGPGAGRRRPARAPRRDCWTRSTSTPRSSTRTSPARPRSLPGSPTTWPTSSPTSATAWPTTARAAPPRPCGGGSSPTSPTGAPRPRRALRALQSLVAHVRLNQPLEELDGLDTDQDLHGRRDAGVEAGKVMAEEIAGAAGHAAGQVAVLGKRPTCPSRANSSVGDRVTPVPPPRPPRPGGLPHRLHGVAHCTFGRVGRTLVAVVGMGVVSAGAGVGPLRGRT